MHCLNADMTLIQIHGITIDPVKWKVVAGGEPIVLTVYQFRLLHLLATNAGRIFTRRQIIEHIHGPDQNVGEHSVDVEVLALRKKLGDHGCLIQTERGVGYGIQA